LVCFLSIKQSAAQRANSGLPQVTNYKRSDYKGGTQNWGIDQDKNGDLYFANNAGLFQFNGSSWNKYSLPNHSQVRCVKTGDSNRIYVGGYDEFGFFQPDAKGRLLYHSLKPLLDGDHKNPIDFIWKIHLLGNRVIFQSFTGAFVYDGKKLQGIRAPGRFQFSFLAGDRLYFQDMSAGLLEYRDNQLLALRNTKALNSTEVWGLFQLDKDRLLIATQNKGLFTYSSGQLTPWRNEAADFLKKNSCLGGVAVRDNCIAFNSVLDGVIICDTSGKVLYHLNQKNGLQNNTVLYSFADNNHNLWLGLDNGIDFINDNSPITYFGSSFNLGTVYASALYGNNLYVATNQGLFYRAWNKALNTGPFEMVAGTTGQAWNVQVVDSSLFCSHNNGLLLISGARSEKVLDGNGYWGVKIVPGKPNVIIGAYYNGFAVFEKNKGRWALKNYLNGITKSSSNFEVSDGFIWMIKDSLLYQIPIPEDLANLQNTRTFRTVPGTQNGIQGLYSFNNKVLLQSGLHFYRFSAQAGTFTEDAKTQDIFRDIPGIRYLKQDGEGNIWYVSNDSWGLLVTGQAGYRSTVAPFANLKSNLEYDYLSINPVDKQNVFVGLTNGLAHINLSQAGASPPNPPAYFSSVLFPGDTIFSGELNEVYGVDPLIPFLSNSVKFTFNAPVYSSLENLEFSYRLKGFDNEWSGWSHEYVKEYSNLHEGRYTMYVKYKVSGDKESKPAVFSFRISPPFYRHPVAYAFYLLLIAFSILLVRKSIKMKIRKNKYYETLEQRKLYLEKETRIRLEQIELQKEIENLKIEKLKTSLQSKDRELVNNSFQVVKKNTILNNILQKIKKINDEALDETTKLQLQRLGKSIAKELDSERSWNDLEKHIKNVHFDFLKRLQERFPEISPRELDLATYLLMNMSSKEISAFLNISSAGVELARYRLRKKLCLSRDQNLVSFLMSV
jgi:DNA-binding CsgD family transcriptional regulator